MNFLINPANPIPDSCPEFINSDEVKKPITDRTASNYKRSRRWFTFADVAHRLCYSYEDAKVLQNTGFAENFNLRWKHIFAAD